MFDHILFLVGSAAMAALGYADLRTGAALSQQTDVVFITAGLGAFGAKAKLGPTTSSPP